NTASIRAMVKHYEEDKEFIYSLDIEHLDAMRQRGRMEGGEKGEIHTTRAREGNAVRRYCLSGCSDLRGALAAAQTRPGRRRQGDHQDQQPDMGKPWPEPDYGRRVGKARLHRSDSATRYPEP